MFTKWYSVSKSGGKSKYAYVFLPCFPLKVFTLCWKSRKALTRSLQKECKGQSNSLSFFSFVWSST